MSHHVIAAWTLALVASSLVLPGCGGEDDPAPVVADMRVRSVTGHFDLTGTTWMRCHADEPATGQSRKTVDVYSAGAIEHTETVYSERTDCTGVTLAVSSMTGPFRVGPDRSVTWNGTPPGGLATSPTASGIEIAPGDGGFKTLAFVDDTVTPRRLYAGNENGTHDADGYPVQLEPLAALQQ